MDVMSNIDKLMEIANAINAKNLADDLKAIKERSLQSNAELIFPLVGEFSSGKTTLINALTDCKKLETATTPTTATIYEIHFGCERCHASVINENGECEEVEDISDLKNESLADATVVNIYDTSTKVPSSTILVDTPGLSSTNPKHKQTLADFLPYADGVLMVIDVNQQITRSLTDFIEMMKLSNRPIFLVVTKCDTKAESEVEAVKKYISDNCQLPISQMACVSAAQNNLDEFYALLETIQKDKNTILAKVNEQRVRNIVSELSGLIDELLQSSSSDDSLTEAIRQQEFELRKLNRNIDKLIEDAEEDIREAGKITIRRFEDTIPAKLEALVIGKSASRYDSAATSIINTTASILLNDYKSKVSNALYERARRNQNTEAGIPLHSLSEIDLSGLSVDGLSYDLNLDSMGHQYDGLIATGVKAVATAAVIAGGFTLLAGAAGAGASVGAESATTGAISETGAAVAKGASKVGVAVAKEASKVGIVDAVQTVAIVGNIVKSNLSKDDVDSQQRVDEFVQQHEELEKINQQVGRTMGAPRGGLVESIVGLVTEEAMAKPQRRRAIRGYMDDFLLPQFTQEMNSVGNRVSDMIREGLHKEAAETVAQKEEALRQLKKESAENESQFKQRMNQLRNYKAELKTF